MRCGIVVTVVVLGDSQRSSATAAITALRLAYSSGKLQILSSPDPV